MLECIHVAPPLATKIGAAFGMHMDVDQPQRLACHLVISLKLGVLQRSADAFTSDTLDDVHARRDLSQKRHKDFLQQHVGAQPDSPRSNAPACPGSGSSTQNLIWASSFLRPLKYTIKSRGSQPFTGTSAAPRRKSAAAARISHPFTSVFERTVDCSHQDVLHLCHALARPEEVKNFKSHRMWSSTWRVLCSIRGTTGLRPGTATTALGSGSGQLSPHKLTASAESGLFNVLRACPAYLPCSWRALEPRELRPSSAANWLRKWSACAHVRDGRFSLVLWANIRDWKRARLFPIFVRVWSGMRHVRHTWRCRATYFIPIVVIRRRTRFGAQRLQPKPWLLRNVS